MQGRTLFKIVKPLALIISLIFKIIPSFILFFIWDLLSIFDNKSTVIKSQIPMVLLMISYTILGLWLLSVPSIG